MEGYIHKIETFGSVDGPGVRFVLFLQGCALRCQYCHNRDSWAMKAGKVMRVEEIMTEVLKYKEFFDASDGGITVSGGEPLLQMPFLIALFTACKKYNIHTTIDTSGDVRLSTKQKEDELRQLLALTDLVLLDVKLMDAEKHKDLTGFTNEHILAFGRFVADVGVPMWIRRTLVPGLTDAETDLRATADYIRELSVVEKVEVLPYHAMGEAKWEQLGYDYPLKNQVSPSEEQVLHAEKILSSALEK